MSFTVQHDRAAHCFQTTVDGVQCVLDYTLATGVMTITHTGVPGEVSGRGIASELVQSAMDTARSEGWKVVPACSYADAWAQRHPAYADVLV